MKLFRTSSANIVQDCQKFFRLLPVSNLIDIRTARFLEEFTINENHVLFVHYLFVMLNVVWLKSFQCILMI